MEKISIFIDVQNIYYTCKQAYSKNFDYNKFWAEVTKEKEIVTAIAYAIDRNDEKQKQFQNILRAIGFEVKLKPYIERSDGTSKGDWDVGIAIDVMEYSEKSDSIILASGDGDFAILLDRIKEKFNTDSHVYGVPELTSNTLIASASKFTAIKNNLLL
jgi:uncharacterized LabA/DUF88 family protein